jgi:2-amino-4-hydroxy-6-hydroxymethyldihydropteridine diphosphokinase
VLPVADADDDGGDPPPSPVDVATPAHWWPAYIALGSNLDDPRAQVERAFAALGELPDSRLVLRSRLYRSAPLGYADQPDFVNAVAAMLTRMAPRPLLDALRALERRLGKVPPAVANGPRRIDLDLLVHGEHRIDEPGLVLPHPRLQERAFVLYPLAELAPQLWIPGRGRVAALRDAVAGQSVEPLSSRPL